MKFQIVFNLTRIAGWGLSVAGGLMKRVLREKATHGAGCLSRILSAEAFLHPTGDELKKKNEENEEKIEKLKKRLLLRNLIP